MSKIIMKIKGKLIKSYSMIIVKLIFGKKIKFNKVNFYGVPIIENNNNGQILLGNNVTLCSKSNFTALGVNHKVILRALGEKSKIIINNNCGLSGTTICATKSVIIGEDCLIGANVIISDTDFHSIDPVYRRFSNKNISSKPVVISNNVFIGMNSIILKGVTIGENSVIGAGSVVVKSIPSNVIAAGNPCKIIRSI